LKDNMTMHLAQGLSTINTRKKKKKKPLTKREYDNYLVAFRKHNKDCKRNHRHSMQYKTVEDYIAYCRGEVKYDASQFQKRTTESTSTPRVDKQYPSLESKGAISGKDSKWDLEKQQISSNYTIAPAYNKGAYQVVPKNEIKHIGK
tara:strand:- start:493 stop:930 length:438 start_codon:yes stop_codon:yes gene_type:complete